MKNTQYRVWLLEHKKMILPKPFVEGTAIDKEDLFLTLDGTVCWSPRAGRIDKVLNDYVLMQSTGLLDKNGKEIFESDVIKRDWEWGSVQKVFESDTTGFEPFCDSSSNCGHCGNGETSTEFIVVGNLYENPELLK